MSKLKGFKAMRDFPGTRAGDIYEPSSYNNLHYWKKVGSYDDTLALEEIFAFSEYFQTIFYSEDEMNSLFIKEERKENVSDFCNDKYEDEELETNHSLNDSLKNEKPSMLGKKIFAVYVEVGNTDPKDVPQYIEKLKTTMPFDKYEDVIVFYIPTKGQASSRVEILQ